MAAWICEECGEEVGWISEGRCIYCNSPGTPRPPNWKMPKSQGTGCHKCPHCRGDGHVLDERGQKWPCLSCRAK